MARRRGHPAVVALAGPNGAGKSTAGPVLLRDTLGISQFVNADVIALGLSGFDPDAAAITAGRVMLRRLRELAGRRENFAFETTLAGRAYGPWLEELGDAGYSFHLVYLWLPDVDVAIRRVRKRVELGGHDVPEETIRRRYTAGLRNFFEIYQPIARTWRFYDNSSEGGPRLIAQGARRKVNKILDRQAWIKASKRGTER